MTTPMVLIHGFAGAPAAWDGVCAELPGSADVRRPTVMGHGASPEMSPATFADEVDRIATAHGEAPPLHLCGYSLGARIALGLAVRHPGRLASLTLVGVHPGLADPGARRERTIDDEAWARTLEQRGMDAFVRAWEQRPVFAAEHELPRAAQEAKRAMRRAHTPAGLARSMRVLGLGRMPDWRPELGHVTVPTTLVVGARDAKFRALADDMVRRMPYVRLEVADGSGHDVVSACPDVVAQALRRMTEAARIAPRSPDGAHG